MFKRQHVASLCEVIFPPEKHRDTETHYINYQLLQSWGNWQLSQWRAVLQSSFYWHECCLASIPPQLAAVGKSEGQQGMAGDSTCSSVTCSPNFTQEFTVYLSVTRTEFLSLALWRWVGVLLLPKIHCGLMLSQGTSQWIYVQTWGRRSLPFWLRGNHRLMTYEREHNDPLHAQQLLHGQEVVGSQS